MRPSLLRPKRQVRLPPSDIGIIPCAGGLVTEGALLGRKAGTLRDSLNYEQVVDGIGYVDIQGYERFSGRPAPSAATFALVHVTISGAVAVDDAITQDTSGATGKVIAVSEDDDGDYLVLTKLTGTFTDSDVYRVGGTIQATPTEEPVTGYAPTEILTAQYAALAADSYRADISGPAGSGAVLGGFCLNGVSYCLRNNAGGTAAQLFKESATGWTAVDHGHYIDFTSGGTYEIAEGDTITGGTSGATADVTRVFLTSGTWAGGTAAGRLYLANKTGTFQSETLDVDANTNVATIGGDASAVVLQPSGDLNAHITNFGGLYTADRAFLTDGVNYLHEFDGVALVFIATGMSPDTPHLCYEHANHLMLAFGKENVISATNDPYSYTLLTGADQQVMQSTITGYQRQPGVSAGETLAIYTDNRIHMLYGSGSADWALRSYRGEVGAIAGSLQQLAGDVFLHDSGLSTLATAQEYGNFRHAMLSADVQRYFTQRRGVVTCSGINWDKGQYRIWFNDGSGMYVTFQGRKTKAFMPVLFPDIPLKTWGDRVNGVYRNFFSDDSGLVFQLDKGTSFDGADLDAYFTLEFVDFRKPGLDKAFREAFVELSGSGYAAYNLRASTHYGDSDRGQDYGADYTASLSEGAWDDGGLWDDGGVWDSQSLTPVRHDLHGISGENLSITVTKGTDYLSPLRWAGFRVRYTTRGLFK